MLSPGLGSCHFTAFEQCDLLLILCCLPSEPQFPYSSNGVNSKTYFTWLLSIKLDETRKNASAIENSDAGSCYHLQFSPEDYLKCQL